MKIVLEFELPKDQKEHDIAIASYKLVGALRELKQFIIQSPDSFDMDRHEKRYFAIMTDAFTAITNKHGVKEFL